MEKISFWREQKTMWAYNKDFYQKALLRRDWYLHREAETIKGASAGAAELCPAAQTHCERVRFFSSLQVVYNSCWRSNGAC